MHTDIALTKNMQQLTDAGTHVQEFAKISISM